MKDKKVKNRPFRKDKLTATRCSKISTRGGKVIHNPVDNSKSYPQNYPQARCS
jgi:hypothetical protein